MVYVLIVKKQVKLLETYFSLITTSTLSVKFCCLVSFCIGNVITIYKICLRRLRAYN